MNSPLLLSSSVMSDSLWPCGLQHARLPGPSLSPRICSNSCPLNRWCHATILSCVCSFSSNLQSFPASWYFLMSWLFTSGGLSIGVSASQSVFPVGIHGWFPLGLTGLISLQSKGLSRVFSSITVWKHPYFGTQITHDSTLTSIHDYWKNHSFDYVDLFKGLSISLLHSQSAVILELPKIKFVIVSIFTHLFAMKWWKMDAMIFIFWKLSFKPAFSLSSLTFIKRLFSSSLLSAIRMVLSAYLRLRIFLLAIVLPVCASSSPAFCLTSAHKLNKQGDNIQPWCIPFWILNQSFVPCLVLTVAFWPAYRLLRRQVRWSCNFIPSWVFQFHVIHTVKSFNLVNEVEIEVFLEFSCFFYDPTDVGDLISGSSAFSKYSLYIWKFSVHILLKPSLKDFEHYLASVWNEGNCVIVWTFFGIVLIWDGNENWPF